VRSWRGGAVTGIGNVSAARELSALKAFIAFARAQTGQPDAAPPRMRGPRIKKGIPRPVTPDDAVNLAAAVEEDAQEEWIGARDRAVLLLLYGAGMRIAEALSLKGAVLPLGEVISVTGKGNKQRVVPLLPIVRDAVADYLAKTPWPVGRDDPVFRGAKGGPLSQGMVQKAMARARHRTRPAAQRDAACAAPQLRDASAWRRGGPSLAAGTAWPCEPRFDADLYQGRCRDAARRLSPRASAGASLTTLIQASLTAEAVIKLRQPSPAGGRRIRRLVRSRASRSWMRGGWLRGFQVITRHK
jgi:hypothetical protein